MIKFFRIIRSFILSFAYLILVVSLVLGASADFSTWTEVDAGSDLTVTADNVTWVDLPRNIDSYVWEDLGSDNFSGNITINFELEINDHDANSFMYPLVISDNVDDWKGLDDSGGSGYAVHFKDNNFGNDEIGLNELDSGTAYQFVIDNLLADNQTYYMTFVRNETVGAFGTIYLYIYDDSARTNLIGTCSIALHTSLKDFRYMQVATTRNDAGGTQEMSGVIRNLTYASSLAPTITTLNATGFAYDSDLEFYTVFLNANVIDDGGENATVGFVIQDITTPDVPLGVNTLGTYNTGDNVSRIYWPLELGNQYRYYAQITNSFNSTIGDNVTFTMELDADVPIMQTLSFPRVLSTENLSANLSGSVLWDGSSNVTGWMQYKLASAENWTDSADNVTGLESADVYSINITGLTLFQTYDYRAVGANDNGTATADSFAQFQLGIEVTTPSAETGNITELTDTSVRFWGSVTDNGSGSTFIRFQYRQLGEVQWNETSGNFVNVGDNFTRDIAGLSPDTEYQWRVEVYNYDINFNRNYAYGDIKQFRTYTSISIPIMSTDNVSYINDSTISVTGSVLFDGGTPCSVWFQVRISGSTTWIDSDFIIPSVVTGEQSTWYISGLELNETYDVRSVGQNGVGTGYGNIIMFTLTVDLDTSTTGGEQATNAVDSFTELINNMRSALRMEGLMGTWFFMGLLLLIVALLFGVAIVATPDETLKRMIGIVWTLISICIVGGFVFTGQLGIIPIVVLVGAFVVGIFVIGGILLSGRQVNG